MRSHISNIQDPDLKKIFLCQSFQGFELTLLQQMYANFRSDAKISSYNSDEQPSRKYATGSAFNLELQQEESKYFIFTLKIFLFAPPVH